MCIVLLAVKYLCRNFTFENTSFHFHNACTSMKAAVLVNHDAVLKYCKMYDLFDRAVNFIAHVLLIACGCRYSVHLLTALCTSSYERRSHNGGKCEWYIFAFPDPVLCRSHAVQLFICHMHVQIQ